MANYSLVVDSRYSPFSFLEILLPAIMATEAHEKRQEAYDKLAEDSSRWGELLDPNSLAYSMWKSFQDELTSATNDLAERGLSVANRKAFSNVRRSYGRNIKAIEEADKLMLAMSALRDLMRAKDASIEYRNNFSIDDFLHGKSVNNESLSGATLRAETADLASKLGAAMSSNPEFSKAMDDYFYLIKLNTGYEPNVLDFIRNGDWLKFREGNQLQLDLYKLISALNDVYQNLVNRTIGYSNDARLRLQDLIFQGLYAGLNKPQYSFLRNPSKMDAGQAASILLLRDRFNFEKEQYLNEEPIRRLNKMTALAKLAGASNKSDNRYMNNTPIVVMGDGSIQYGKGTGENPISVKNAVKLTVPFKNGLDGNKIKGRIMTDLANILGVDSEDRKDANKIWEAARINLFPYYDVYYNSLKAGSEDVTLSLLPKYTKVAAQSPTDAYAPWSDYAHLQAAPQVTTTNNNKKTDSSKNNSTNTNKDPKDIWPSDNKKK